MSEHHLRLVGRHNLPVDSCETYFVIETQQCLLDNSTVASEDQSSTRTYGAREELTGESNHP
eukprot:8405819-Pyramimonas_sp.AAC.1